MKSTSEYKKDAREQLGGDIFGSKWLYAMIFEVVIGVILGLLAATGIGSFATIIIVGPLMFGATRAFKRIMNYQDEKIKFGNLFVGFKEKFGDSVITAVLVSLFEFLWTLLFIIPGFISSYSHSLVFYILEEEPELTPMEAIKKSKKLMKGHKADLFALDLSFIGWYIVGMLAFGFGTLWVAPYHDLTKYNFLKDVYAESKIPDVYPEE